MTQAIETRSIIFAGTTLRQARVDRESLKLHKSQSRSKSRVYVTFSYL